MVNGKLLMADELLMAGFYHYFTIHHSPCTIRQDMLRYLKTNKAQAVMGEYALLLLLVMGMIMAMTVYFKRGIQARIYDARNSMMNTVANRAGDYYGNILLQGEYEPYYGRTDSMVVRQENTGINLLPGNSTGIFHKTVDGTTAILTQSETAPPREAN